MTGQELREVRQLLGISQAEFGTALGYHHPQVRIAELENGVRVVPKRVIAACDYIKENSRKKNPIRDIPRISGKPARGQRSQ